MTERILEFESGNGARAVVDGFDAASGTWRFSFAGAFWSAVRHAHSLGFRGAGRRVAVIDSGCDLRIPRLRRQVDSVRSLAGGDPSGDPLFHGTAVALLITEVAPEARVDVYQVAGREGLNESAVINAIEAASDSSADVINLSIASQTPFQFSAEQISLALRQGDGSGKKFAVESPPCRLCVAAESALAKGKLVFAAAGNRPNTKSCPARVPAVAAVGFGGVVERLTPAQAGGMTRTAFGAVPSAPQALLVDFSLAEIAGVLGTSFACPLYAGAAALGLSSQEYAAYVAAASAAAWPQLLHGLIRSSPDQPQPVLMEATERAYVQAQQRLPHVHCDYQGFLNAVHFTDPSKCPFCGVFAEALLVNHGLWLLETGRVDAARSLLQAARAVAPWSADAASNLGALEQSVGDIPLAIALFEDALRLRPGAALFEATLKRLRAKSRDRIG